MLKPYIAVIASFCCHLTLNSYWPHFELTLENKKKQPYMMVHAVCFLITF
jgi:hypothetical protein